MKEASVCFGVALAVAVLVATNMQLAYADDQYDIETYDGGTWFIRAQVYGHGTPNPLQFLYAEHEGYRTAWGWPWAWPLGNLKVTIVGHAYCPGHGIWPDDSYNNVYYYTGNGGQWITGPYGIFAGFETYSHSDFASPLGPWEKTVVATVGEGPI